MPARGTIAKTKVTEVIKKAFGSSFMGEDGSKLYVKVDDGGEMVKIAISLTCPKDTTGIDMNEPSAFKDDSFYENLLERLKL